MAENSGQVSPQEQVLRFLERHDSFILTTHENADADGLGAELVFACILGQMGKKVRILNSEIPAERFRFMDPGRLIESWDPSLHGGLSGQSALLILDTADEYNIGRTREILALVRETMAVDHHEKNKFSSIIGLIDPTASSACELAVETALAAGIRLDNNAAVAAFAGIIYDTGSLSYIKTTVRTFRICLMLVEAGVVPYFVYGKLNESGSMKTLLLQKKVLSTLDIHCGGRVAVQVLRKEDLESTGASFEDAESFVNVPLCAKDVAVSVLVKENTEGKVRCSLRSKGEINVSKIARAFNGGGHVTSAGFRSESDVEETLARILERIGENMAGMEK
ncbi:MAG: bifunctional oligoribonuclease/PAP phosphatase NrnA [Treponema sp.]|jgi:phosphoesterase RecJ-like protein|nr:bifunctional oligoribonuclease/PAP phosphatase NrnA [Treponema sp.]